MAQLSDDCFAFDGPLLPVEEAMRRMERSIPPIAETETVPLAHALGRVAATDIRSPIALPPFDNSAVDGYAVRLADVAADGDTRLRVAGRIAAGMTAANPLGAGEAVRIFTGAPMPPGADTVYMQEDVRLDRDAVVVPAGLRAGANRRLAGEDIRAGATAIAAGRRLGPAEISLVAALGMERVVVRRRVRVALFSTGNEVVEPGAILRPGSIYDSNRHLLRGMLERIGAATSDLGILADDPAILSDAIADAARRHDLVLTSGGVSTGEADQVKAAVEKLGRLVFWRLAIKPGRPVAMGVIGGTAFAGLPGNPVAAFVTFVHVVRPLLERLAGTAPEPLLWMPVRAAFSYRKKSGRREYVRATLRVRDGIAEAERHAVEGAGIITSLTETTGLVEIADDVTRVAPGDSVGYLPYASLIG